MDNEEIKADKTIICAKCFAPFIWTKGEQEYFEKIGLKHEPKLCPKCREERKKLKAKEIICIACGKKSHIRGEIPHLNAYCEDCFEKIKKEAQEKGEKIEEIKE